MLRAAVVPRVRVRSSLFWKYGGKVIPLGLKLVEKEKVVSLLRVRNP